MVALTATVQTLTAQLASTQTQLVAALAADANKGGGGAGNRNRDQAPIHMPKGNTSVGRAVTIVTTTAAPVPTKLPVTLII